MNFSEPRVAIIHDWLTNMGGAENVVLAIMEIFPNADLYTLVCNINEISPEFKKYEIHTSFLQKLPFLSRRHQLLLPLMPLAIESFDLMNYDLVISSSSACAKGVIVREDAKHICYCHNAMRYAWDAYNEFIDVSNVLKKFLIMVILHNIRIWDRLAAERVDHFIANSKFVAGTIKKYYNRESTIIYPPVNIDEIPFSAEDGGFYIIVSRLVPYKRIDLCIEAFNELGLPLVVIGDGPEKKRLQSMAKPNIEFLGGQPKNKVYEYVANSKGLIQAAKEYFGIALVEALAAGKPVAAYAKGGALDIVIDGVNGVLFYSQTVNALKEAVMRLEKENFDHTEIRCFSEKFSKALFKDALKNYIRKVQNDSVSV